MEYEELTVSHFLDILYEIEIFGKKFIEENVEQKRKELVLNNLIYIRNVFCEVFISSYNVPNINYSFGVFDCSDLIRDVFTLYCCDYFTKEEVVRFMTNLDHEAEVEKIYQRI
jgi:hypothetical protein